MRERTRHRFEDERGASLSMALLVFLVCAVVASIVLTATSAASGRLAQLRETDRSYYNVTSAARLFLDILGENKSATVERTCTGAVETGDGWNLSSVVWEAQVDGNEDFSKPTLLQMLAYDTVFGTVGSEGTRSLDSGTIKATIDSSTFTSKDQTLANVNYEFTMEDNGDSFNPVKVTVTTVDAAAGVVEVHFEEKSDPISVCTLVMSVNVAPGEREKVGEQAYSWTTTVTWNADPLYINAPVSIATTSTADGGEGT